MSEESILILNMLREGKITAEQADSLLRAVRTTAPPPPVAPTPPTAPAVDPATLAQMQHKLGELQGKLGDLQGKLGAAQTARAAGQAASLMGKALDHLPKPDLDFLKINKSVDEALRGLSSFKNDAVRTAKVAARQAGQEARKAAKQGRKAFDDLGFTVTIDSGGVKRPANADSKPQAQDTSDSTVTWAGAERLALANIYGSLAITGTDTDTGMATATLTKTAWAETEADARVLLQQVFLTSRVEGGKCTIEIVAPADAKDRLTVDCAIQVPRHLSLETETTHGALTLEETSASLSASAQSGNIIVRRPTETAPGDARLCARSGTIRLENWNAPQTSITAETTTGDIISDGLSCRAFVFESRSGDVTGHKVQTVGDAYTESISGDVGIAGGSVGGRLTVKTQSGQANVRDLRTDNAALETVSGDAFAHGLTGTVSVKTVSGDIAGEAIGSTAASLGTVSGDMRWSYAAPFSGSLAATSVSGDVRVALWSNSDTRIDMNTTSGDAVSRLPLSGQSPPDSAPSSRSVSGILGAGMGSVKLQSVSGDLLLEESAP